MSEKHDPVTHIVTSVVVEVVKWLIGL